MKTKLLIPILLTAAILVLISCNSNTNAGKTGNTPAKDSVTTATPDSINKSPGKTIKICSFNIQNFGKTKVSKPEATSVLADIFHKYEVIAVQEISDVSNQTCPKMLAILNAANGSHYQYICSEHTGKTATTGQQEQYAYFYNADKIEVVGDPLLYDDSSQDLFVREPYLARFKVKNTSFTFVLCDIHTNPEAAVSEIGNLNTVVNWAENNYKGEKDIIALGDFNGSCEYATPAALDQLPIRDNNYYWVIPDSANTNLAQSDCAYDRMVITKETKTAFTNRWGVDRCYTSKTISDHWPVWAEFYVGKDGL